MYLKIIVLLWLNMISHQIVFVTSFTNMASPRKLYSLFVYHEAALLSSGYQNWGSMGCGVFTNTDKTAEFVDFINDPTNRVGELNLDVVPLYKNFDTLIQNYDSIIHNATNYGVKINFLESNLIPGDSCQENCPESCSAAPNSRNDSCTPVYMNLFHNMVGRLFKRYSSSNSSKDNNYQFGIVYDIEQSDPTVNRDLVWNNIIEIASNFNTFLMNSYSNMLTDTSIVRPSIKGFTSSQNWLNIATKINHMKYFSPLLPDWKTSEVSSGETGTILYEVNYCKNRQQKQQRDEVIKGRQLNDVNNNCKIQIGWETTAEPVDCKTFHHCPNSWVWGGGVDNSSSLTDWIENTFEPYLSTVGIDVATDLAEIPYFIEHHAAFMAYQKNLKTPGVFPAISCFRKESGCSTCCPNQKHKGVFCTE